MWIVMGHSTNREYIEEVVKTSVERSIRFGEHRVPERMLVCLHVSFLRNETRAEIKLSIFWTLSIVLILFMTIFRRLICLRPHVKTCSLWPMDKVQNIDHSINIASS
jgi:hypothetical protein